MEFDGIKISSGGEVKHSGAKPGVPFVKAEVPQEERGVEAHSAEIEEDKDTASQGHLFHGVGGEDYYLDDAGVGKDILEDVKSHKEEKVESLVYGATDSDGASLSVRIDNFLIDHSSINLKEKSYFFHMLAVMVDAGIPVLQAVKSLARRTRNRRFARVLNTVAHISAGGASLSDSMSRFSDVFDEAELGIIKSGEATGSLDRMLFKLSARLDKRHELKMKLWGAAVYPIVVLSVLVVISVIMLIWVFPTLLNLLESGGFGEGELPLTTRGLILIQGLVVNYWWAGVLAAVAAYGTFKAYVGTAYGAVRWDYLKLKIPLVGVLLRKIYVLYFVSMLGMLIESGLPVLNSLRITGNALTNRVFKLKVQEVINEVKQGGKISESLKDSQFLFPAEVIQMIAVGEQSASLGPISEKISDQYQREIDNSLDRLKALFGPIMILFVGVAVALMAIAIMAPIFNLGDLVGGV
jgi:type II secretory pathway component PulF